MKHLNRKSAKKITYSYLYSEHPKSYDGDIILEYCDGSVYRVRDVCFATLSDEDLGNIDAEELREPIYKQLDFKLTTINNNIMGLMEKSKPLKDKIMKKR